MQFDIAAIIDQMFIFFILLAVGFALTKLKLLTAQSLTGVSAYIMNASLPAAMIIILSESIDRAQLPVALPAVFLFLILMAVQFSMGYLSGKALGFDGNLLRVHVFQYEQGNSGLVGIPLFLSVLGPQSSFYISLIMLCDFLALCFMGTYLSHDYKSDYRFRFDKTCLKSFMNPLFFSLIIGLLFIVTGFRLTGPVRAAMGGLGDSLKYVSMLYIGGTLAGADLRRIEGFLGIVSIVVLKMTVTPVVIFWLLGFLPGIVSPLLRLSITLASSLPSAFSMAMMARQNGSNYIYPTISTFFTTLCSLVTIPLVCYLTNLIA